MEPSTSDCRYTTDDLFGIAGPQLLGLLAGALSGVLCGVHYFDATLEYGIPARIPYGALFSVALGGVTVFQAVGLVTRFREVWTALAARDRIVLGLVQVALTGAMLSLAGFLLAGRWIDFTTPGQSIITWVYYGMVASGVLHAVIAAAGLALLMAKRELPEIDG